MNAEELIRVIPDYPKEGIKYRDITTLIKDRLGFQMSIDRLTTHCAELQPDVIAGIDARGFIFGSAIAYKLNLGFIPIRKEGKLPAKTLQERYELEYGTDCLEIHADAMRDQPKILVVDDLLATGGTASATADLVKKAGGQLVGCAFIVELTALGGRERLPGDIHVESLIHYS